MKRTWLVCICVSFALVIIGCKTEDNLAKNENDENHQSNLNKEEEIYVSGETNENNIDVEEIELEVPDEVLEIEQPQTKTGNYNGNIAQGGLIAYSDDTLYISSSFDEGVGIYQLPIENGEPELLIEMDASDLHVTEDGIYFIEKQDYYTPVAIQHYSFETQNTEPIIEGDVRNLQMTDEYLWFVKDSGTPEAPGGMIAHRIHLETGAIEELPFSESLITVDNDHLLVTREIFTYYVDTIEGTEEQIAEMVSTPIILDDDTVFYNSHEGIKAQNLETNEVVNISDEQADYFNVRNGHVFYSPIAGAEVVREIRYATSDGSINESLEGLHSSFYMFEDFMVAFYGRQGVISYTKFDYETEEWSSIYHKTP